MWILEAVPQMGAFAVLTLIIGLVPLAMALAYVANPSERRLALMRPLSLAGIFGALTGVFSGFITVLRGIGTTSTLTTGSWQRIAIGAGEALVPVFFGFACLTVAWILVALGMRRTA
jgi:Zn-dependent protease with chaperone function